MMSNLVSKIKGWWNRMFDYKKIINDFGLDSQTSNEMLEAIKLWTAIFNGNAPWIKDEVVGLNVAKTICEKVANAVTIEMKSSVNDKYIDEIYQKLLDNIKIYVEFAIGKGNMFFKPTYENGKITISIIQADKFIPFKFDSTGKLQGMIIVDQLVRGNDVYTRLEYNELIDNSIKIKNIVYKGQKNGVILGHKIPLTHVEKWQELKEEAQIDGVDKLIGGFFNMKNANTVDNDSPLGVSLFHNAIDTLKEIDKQFSRILWEYEGSELAVHIDSTLIEVDDKLRPKYPKGKKRLYRAVMTDEDGNSKGIDVFSPVIRDESQFNGLNELLRQCESECQIAFGVISKEATIAKTATEIKSSKQDYYVTVSSIQTALQHALEDLVYGIYVLCRLYKIPVGLNYEMSFDWDDSILVDKESLQRQSMLELNAEIIDKVQYLMETRDYSEQEAIEFISKIEARKPKEQIEPVME